MFKIATAIGATLVLMTTALPPGGAPAEAAPHGGGGGGGGAPHMGGGGGAPHIGGGGGAPHMGGGGGAPHIGGGGGAPHMGGGGGAPRIGGGGGAPHMGARFAAPHGGAIRSGPRVGAVGSRAVGASRGRAFAGRSATRSAERRIGNRSATSTRSASHGRLARQASGQSVAHGRSQRGSVTHSASRDQVRSTSGRVTTAAPNGTGRSRAQPGLHNGRGGSIAGMAFGARHGDHGFARRGFRGGFVGWAGPVFWPYAYDDMFNYAFWPSDYEDNYWAYAYDGAFDSLFSADSTAYAYDTGVESAPAPTSGARGRRAARRSHGRSADVVQTCSQGESGVTEYPIERIRQTVKPNPSQQAALDELKAASAKAGKLLQAACPATLPATPLGRLSAMDDRLEATLQAVDIMRPALANFYGLLSDEQKARFNAIDPQQKPQAQQSQSPVSQDQPEICGAKLSALPDRTVQRIEQVVRPTQRQRAALDQLKDASSKASETLHTACPAETPATPVARLEAMTKRIEAMLQAVAVGRPALKTFYGELTDEQKSRFNTMTATQQG